MKYHLGNTESGSPVTPWLWRFLGSPASSVLHRATQASVTACLPPVPRPPCTWQVLGIGLQGNHQDRKPTHSYLNLPRQCHQFEKGLSLPEAKEESWDQNVRTETTLADFSCQYADPWLQSCARNHGGRIRVSIKINRLWMIAQVKIFWFFWVEARIWVQIPT